MKEKTVYLGLSRGDNYGWGVVCKYLRIEFAKRIKIVNIDEMENADKIKQVDGIVLVVLLNQDFNPLFDVKGTETYGYAVFESSLNFESFRNSRNYTKLLTASTWNKEKLIESNIFNTEILIQGIDPELFYPSSEGDNKDLFIIFSGGKFELRKGQDIVIKAVKHMMDKFKDVVLINSWFNLWPQTMKAMSLSKHIKFNLNGNSWKEIINNLLFSNGLDLTRVITLELVDNAKMRDIYNKTTIGLFPNRCEGGTNLVMMEYMACGKPVIASYNTGHKDIINEKNSLMIKTNHPFNYYDPNTREIQFEWYEPDLDEVISNLEYAYYNRDKLKSFGTQASIDLKNFTWAHTADNFLKIIGN